MQGREDRRIDAGTVADDEPFLWIRVNAHINEEDGSAGALVETVVKERLTAGVAQMMTIWRTTSPGTRQLRRREHGSSLRHVAWVVDHQG